MFKAMMVSRLVALVVPVAASMIIPGAVLALPGYQLAASKLGPVIVKVVTDKIVDKNKDSKN